MTATALRGHQSNAPRAVDRATRPTSRDAEIDAALMELHRDLRARGRFMSPKGLRRLYLRWLALYERGDLLAYVLTYADPTGETAVRGSATKRRRPA